MKGVGFHDLTPHPPKEFSSMCNQMKAKGLILYIFQELWKLQPRTYFEVQAFFLDIIAYILMVWEGFTTSCCSPPPYQSPWPRVLPSNLGLVVSLLLGFLLAKANPSCGGLWVSIWATMDMYASFDLGPYHTGGTGSFTTFSNVALCSWKVSFS